MANFKDHNADLGNQTIEGTEPPIALDAEIVMPDGSTRPIPTAAELDAQLEALMADDQSAQRDVPPVVVMPPQDAAPVADETQDLDAQLAALMAEPDVKPDRHSTTLDDINAQIDAILNSTGPDPVVVEPQTFESITENDTEIVQTTVTEQTTVEAQPDDRPTSDEPIIIAPPVTEQPPMTEQPSAAEQRPVTEQPQVAAQPTQDDVRTEQPVQQAQQQENDAAREMLEQARLIMEQAKLAQEAAQQAAQSAQQAATQSSQQRPAAPATQPVSQPQFDANDPAAQSIIRQAQMMLQQAQQAQLQAQQAAQQAQMQAQQVVQATTRTATHPPVSAPDSYAVKEVDRLKNELDGMRELVNKLTFTLAQMPGGAQQVAQMPPHYAYNGGDQEQYRKLQSELEGMRREIIEKDLRDREKELERRQKEAENTVKDIRPEMIQMSDSRDVAPLGGQSPLGSEFIPLANGVFYSMKDKQVYVMTPASNAAAASPTIEPPKPQAAPARPAPRAHARPVAKKRPVMHSRRPGMPPRRRPGAPSRRPTGR